MSIHGAWAGEGVVIPRNERLKRLGVFICHCGVNIAGTVDVKSVAEKMGKIEDVRHSTDYIYMCSNGDSRSSGRPSVKRVWMEWWSPVAHRACMRIPFERLSNLKG